MPSEPLPIERNEFLKDRKTASSEPVEIAPARWRESPTTPSSHCHNDVYGSPAFRRPVTGHGKPVDGIWNIASVESVPRVSVSNYDGVSTTGGHRLEKEVSLGSSLDWKPVKWIRSGSLSSRGSGFSHLSSCKIAGVDSFDTKMEGQQGNVALVQSPSGDSATCVTPKTPDEVNSRKKPRLGWGEGLAKYEKKKVGPADIVDKENGSTNGTADGVSSSESVLPSPSSLTGKSPSLTGNSENASPTSSCSIAYSLSPGPEEKTSITTTTVNNDTSNNSSVAVSQNDTHESTFNLENLDITEGFNLSQSLDELLQTDDTSVQGSGFAMNKLQVWKADISRTLEATESEIDFLEHESKSDEDSHLLDTRPEKAECSQDLVCRDASCTVSIGGEVNYDRKDRLRDSIYGSNKAIANSTSDELSKLLPTAHVCTSVLRDTDDSEIMKKVVTRKRFLKFKERVTTLKFRTFQYAWKDNLRMHCIRSGSKSHKKFESSSRMGYADHQKLRAYNHSRLSSSAGSWSLVPTKEVVGYANTLLSDSWVKTYRKAAKMPVFILDKKERMSSRFISDNGLVENPVDVEKERSVLKFWTVEDKATFLDKYSLFGKNFRKIASFFQHKTVADCVEFYYKYHKCELFQQTKNKSEFAKAKSLNANNTYLVTSGKRLNQETRPTSLDMLGAASEMVASYCDEQETAAAADVLAGICRSVSSEALGSCITSSVDHQKLDGSSKRRSLNDVDEETCSDDSCGEEINSSIWTDEEKSSFVKALRSYGKDFSMISRCMGTRSSDQCKLFFSKARKCLGLDVIDLVAGCEGTTGANLGGGGDQDDACMVDSGSGISHEKSSIECKIELEESDSREEHVESDRNVIDDYDAENKFGEKGLNGNFEGAADSEAVNMEESPRNTSTSDSASGAKVEEPDKVAALTTDHVNTLDLNAASENFTGQETTSNGFMMSNLFPREPERKTFSCDDVSSRLTFRKCSQRSSSIDGYQLHLHKRAKSRDEPQCKLNLDESLLLPTDGCLQTGTGLTSNDQQRRSSSLDIEMPNRNGDLKLFGQIITNHSLPKLDAVTRSNMDYVFGGENKLHLKTSYGFWDGNRIQTGFSSLPTSAVLLAKYPAASTLSKLDEHPLQQLHSSLENGKEQCNSLNVASGFQTRKVTNSRGSSFHAYGQPITVGGVSDPVAAIRLHYAKTEQYKDGGSESWRNNVSDIGSR